MDKLYLIDNLEYKNLFKKYDKLLIKQFLLSNFIILINTNINFIYKFINLNINDNNPNKKIIFDELKSIEKKLKIVKHIDQSVIIEKIYIIILNNKNTINSLYNPNKIDNTISIKKWFNFLIFKDNINITKIINGLIWCVNNYNKDNDNNNYIIKIMEKFAKGNDLMRIKLIFKIIKKHYSNIKETVLNNFKQSNNNNNINNKWLLLNKKSNNDLSIKHFYLISNIIKKLITHYDKIDENEYIYNLCNLIIDEFNLVFYNILNNNNNRIEKCDDNTNYILNNIDIELIKKYNDQIYNFIITKNILFNNDNSLIDLKEIFYNFCYEANLMTDYDGYITFYIDNMFDVIDIFRNNLIDFIKNNIPIIRDFNKNLYYLLILSERYFDLSLSS
tara:strand:+ start:2328 stop:3494 length:1167 start_codon:yes stop_codon:yes gene_type:complete